MTPGAALGAPPGERCIICDTPLGAHDVITRPTCGARECQWRHRSTPAHHRCRYCQRPLDASKLASRVCDASDCRRQVFHELREQKRREWDALEASALVLRDEYTEAAEVPNAGAYGVDAVSAFRGALTPLARERRRAYRARLASLIRQALERRAAGAPYEEPTYPPVAIPEDFADVVRGVCTLCAGGCCSGGNEHAYLAVDTLRRWFDEHPGAGPRDAFRAYLAHLPSASVENSCINHTERGCALPRELRSDTCNRFHCGTMVSLLGAAERDQPIRRFLVAERRGTIEGAAFVERRRLRVVYRRETDAPAADAAPR